MKIEIRGGDSNGVLCLDAGMTISEMDPGTAVIKIVGSNAHISDSQRRALKIACRNGGYVAAGKSVYKGSEERVAATTIASLIRAGYLHQNLGTDGGYAGVLSPRSWASLTASAPDSKEETSRHHATKKKSAARLDAE